MGGPRTVSLAWPDAAPPPARSRARIEPPLDEGAPVVLVHGDNLAAMQALHAARGACAALVYVDPPFFTGRDHAFRERVEGERRREEAGVAFEDRWPDLAAYLEALRDRMSAARELLAPHGCLVVHVDSKTSHYARVLGDGIFGRDAFASEIIWRYRRWPAKTANFQRVHDVLLRFVRDPSVRPRFHQLYEPLAESTRAVWGSGKQRAVVKEGRRTRSETTAEPSPGVPLGDVWEIGIVAPSGKERTGYPTQKPEALLERLVSACTEPGDLVVDPTLGSGTTLVVAARLGRRAVGIDASDVAIRTAEERLFAAGHAPVVARVVEPSEETETGRQLALFAGAT